MTFRELIDQGWSISIFTSPSYRLIARHGPGHYGYIASHGKCSIDGTAPTWEALEAELTDRHERALQSGAIRS